MLVVGGRQNLMGFDRAIELVLRFEGGYVNDPADRGGATNFGITQAVYDEWRKSRGQQTFPVADITDVEVRVIYREKYWLDGRCDTLPWPLQLVHFDGCVHHGVTQAVKLLQRIIGTPDDGKVGPATLDAIARVIEKGRVYEAAHALLWDRLGFYCRLVVTRPSNDKFLRGWVVRMKHLWDECRV
jgi:lysozyme family protein